MIVNDITFIKHELRSAGAPLFCDLDQGTLHLNTSYDKRGVHHYDSATNREFDFFKWIERNMEGGLVHETVHLSMVEIGERDASLLLNALEKRHNISGYDFNVLDSEFTTKDDKNE